jgi:hypothetical protein
LVTALRAGVGRTTCSIFCGHRQKRRRQQLRARPKNIKYCYLISIYLRTRIIKQHLQNVSIMLRLQNQNDVFL